MRGFGKAVAAGVGFGLGYGLIRGAGWLVGELLFPPWTLVRR